MRITYYALKRQVVGADVREPGDLIPEAADWAFRDAKVRDGQIAVVLVATLPEAQQAVLLQWEQDNSEQDNSLDFPAKTAEPDDEKAKGKKKVA